MKKLGMIVALMVAANLSFASGHKDGKWKEKIEQFKKELNLTEDQAKKSEDIRKEHGGELQSSRQKFMELKRDFKEAMKNPTSKREDLTAKFESFQAARDDFQKKRFVMMLEMRSILSPEQLVKFNEMKEKRHGGKRHGRK